MCEKTIYLSQNYPLWCAVYPEFAWWTDENVRKEAELTISDVNANVDGPYLIVGWTYHGGDALYPMCAGKGIIIDEISVFGLTEEDAIEKARFVGVQRRNEAKLEWQKRLPQCADDEIEAI